MSVIVRHLTAISRCGFEYRKNYLEKDGIDARHARFLVEICDSPGISQEGLSRRLLVDKSTVTRVVTALEDGGYIERRTCAEDRRIIRIYPTEKSVTLLPKINGAWDSWEEQITKDLTAEEIQQLRELLRKMKVAARTHMEEG